MDCISIFNSNDDDDDDDDAEGDNDIRAGVGDGCPQSHYVAINPDSHGRSLTKHNTSLLKHIRSSTYKPRNDGVSQK